MTPAHDPQQAPAPHARRAHTWRRYLHFWRTRVDADIDDELQLHIELRTRDYAAAGLTESAARAAASRRLGDLTDARRQCLTIGQRRQRRMTRTHMLDALRQDVRFALRMFARQKAWTAIAVLTLALGIGASAAVFSVMRSVVLHPYPLRDADRIVKLWTTNSIQHFEISPSPALVRFWQANSHAFESIQQYASGTVTLTGTGEATTLNTVWMQRDLPRFAGVPLLRGRTFTAEEGADSTSHVAIIGEALWRQRFGGGDVVGARILLNQVPYTIVGVAPATLRIPIPTALLAGPVMIWLPYAGSPLGIPSSIGRLRAGTSIEAAQRELAGLTDNAKSAALYGTDHLLPKLEPLSANRDLKTSADLLAGGVALLLMISCANVAHLLLARGAARRRELSLRRALGASGVRLIRQALTEASLLSLLGCGLGLAAAYGGVALLVKLRPPAHPELAYTHMDGEVLAWALAVSLGTGLLFALVGARQHRSEETADTLKGTSLSGTGTLHHQRVRATLVVTEMALSALLLVGAGLLVRSIMKLESIDPGFDAHDVYTMRFDPPQDRYTSEPAVDHLMNELRARARAIPGVEGVSIAASAPPNTRMAIGGLEAQGRPPEPGGSVFTPRNIIDPAYLPLLGISVLRGRNFDARSADRSEAIISAATARILWHGAPAVGRQFRIAPPKSMGPLPAPWLTVVAVVPDALRRELGEDADLPMVYLPAASSGGFFGVTLIVRASAGLDPSAALHRLSLSIDPLMAPPPVVAMDRAIEQTIAARRFTMLLLSTFAGIAVLLAAIGLYGVIAYSVAQQTREIGIRIALGAMPRNVASMVLMHGAALSLTGLALGLAGSVWGTRLLRSSLFGVGTSDPASLLGVGALLVALSVLACIVPTRRAMRIDPLIAMRAE
jgi:predicted permease